MVLVQLAVRHVDLISLEIDAHLRRVGEVRRVVAAAARAGTPNLPEEFPLAREHEYVRVPLAVAADPDTILSVDGDAVHLLRPVVAGARASPRLHHVACRVEFDDGRRRCHAGLLDRLATVNDPDVIARVCRDAADGTDRPVIRQRLRPRGIDFENRHGLRRLRSRDRHQRSRKPCHRDERGAHHYCAAKQEVRVHRGRPAMSVRSL